MYTCKCLKDIKEKDTDWNLRNRNVSAPENDDSEGQSHGLSELEEVGAELEIPYNECVIAVSKNLRKQDGKYVRKCE